MAHGKFITLEGGEGAGKSTQLRALAEALRRDGHRVVTTREPGGSPGAEIIREVLLAHRDEAWDPLTEALLHFAARREHLVRTVLPALARGDWVISDRFADSTMAYQGYGLGLGRPVIEALYAQAVGEFRPDVTVILDLPVEEGLARAAARGDGSDRYEDMDLDFHRRLRDGFLDIAKREPERCVVIDARAPLNVTAEAVIKAVKAKLDGAR